MSRQPITYGQNQAMHYFNIQPSSVDGKHNLSVEQYKRYLYTEAASVFSFTLPKWWAKNWFRYWLFHHGSICAIYTNSYGWIPQPYTVMNYDYQYNPHDILVSNAYLDNVTYGGRIGINAVIFKLMDDYQGIEDLTTQYAVLLAQTERSLNVNLMNSNISYLFESGSKKQAMEIQKAYSQASHGKPLVMLNKDVMDNRELKPFLSLGKNGFFADTILEVRRGIVNEYLTKIGIRNVSVQKKERLTQGETNENNDETRSVAEIMLENLKESFDNFTKLSGLTASVSLRYDYNQNVSRETSNGMDVSRET